jgi:hypothetical protein
MMSKAQLAKYGLTPEEWQRILDYQGNRCAMCNRRFVHRSLPPCVDHGHASGIVRGALCRPCNYVLGERHDNMDWFKNTATYLKDPPAVSALGGIHYVPGSFGDFIKRRQQ